ncbi:restriction endonuclease subunit S [Bacillus sp. FJAT-29937]|uniref:restriction endonuclease subunit S n=1 Tax=Bacillus sp. FJAT-29937 TaxID=1720553 RepID=UPI00082AD8C1|nr:restriction endonuclease subunit S [Bacillus sp. FJAT-29937]
MLTRAMKDSGVRWIGGIPSNWELSTIGAHYKQRNEKVSDLDFAPLSVTKNGVVPQLDTVAKSSNHNDRKLVKKDDFVINSRSDRKMSAGIANEDGSVSLINTVLFSKSISKEYTKYLLKNTSFAEEFYRWGTGIVADLWSTKWDKMKKISIPVPLLDEQMKIADKLNEITNTIDLIISDTQQSIEELKQYKQALITEVVTKGLDKNVEMKMVDDIEIPNNWEYISLGNIFNFIGGNAYKSDKFKFKTNNQVIRISNVKNFELNLDKAPVFIDDDYAKETVIYKIKEDDILFTMTGTKGKRDYFYSKLITKFDVDSKNLYLNQRVGILRRKSPNLIINYFDYVLKIDSVLDQVFDYETGTANQGNIGFEYTKKVKVPVPSIEEQKEIVIYLDNNVSKIDTLLCYKEEIIEEFEQYKKSLIYEYITGKKEV